MSLVSSPLNGDLLVLIEALMLDCIIISSIDSCSFELSKESLTELITGFMHVTTSVYRLFSSMLIDEWICFLQFKYFDDWLCVNYAFSAKPWKTFGFVDSKSLFNSHKFSSWMKLWSFYDFSLTFLCNFVTFQIYFSEFNCVI